MQSLSKEAAGLVARISAPPSNAEPESKYPPAAFSVRFRPPREARNLLLLFGRDALWQDIRRLFERRVDELAGEDWTPSMVREIEKSLMEESPSLRGAFLGCLRHVCDMERFCQVGITMAEASFLHHLQRRLEARTPFLKSSLTRHSLDLLREARAGNDWRSLVAICDLARVLGARMGRHPLYQPLTSDVLFWELLLGFSLQARSWNRLHKNSRRLLRPLDFYIAACIVPTFDGAVPTLAQMRPVASGSRINAALDRWLLDVAQTRGSSLIASPVWKAPWSWLRQAADQLTVTPPGTRSAVIATVSHALQETGWEADRPKQETAMRLPDAIEVMAKRYVPDPEAAPKTPSHPALPTTADALPGFEMGNTISIFELTGNETPPAASPLASPPAPATLTPPPAPASSVQMSASAAAALPPSSSSRNPITARAEVLLESLRSGATESGRTWWVRFLSTVARESLERQNWARFAKSIQDPQWIAGFEDLVRYIYPAAVRPESLEFLCSDRYPHEARRDLDTPTVEFLLAACDASLDSKGEQAPLVLVRFWQSQTSANLLPSHSPGWWSWIAQEGPRRVYSLPRRTVFAALTSSFSRNIAMPSLPTEDEIFLRSCLNPASVPEGAEITMDGIATRLEESKESALHTLLTRF